MIQESCCRCLNLLLRWKGLGKWSSFTETTQEHLNSPVSYNSFIFAARFSLFHQDLGVSAMAATGALQLLPVSVRASRQCFPIYNGKRLPLGFNPSTWKALPRDGFRSRSVSTWSRYSNSLAARYGLVKIHVYMANRLDYRGINAISYNHIG